ncbi:unnamed protein product [Heligmosomoides polygyrus]|uniref:ADF-H domain-containing protein n=1 Tax=Heligmosomoides polygyrus TaxID=6339 RepID=A0A183GPG5_HELPZ|nr:unnamed protein product [Heligmosomoides polygyrus]
MSTNPRVLTLKWHPTDAEVWISTGCSSFEGQHKLAERIANVPQDFELRQLKIDEVEKLEVAEEEDHKFPPEEDCAKSRRH